MECESSSSSRSQSDLLDAVLRSIDPNRILTDSIVKSLSLLVGAPMLLNALDLIDHSEGMSARLPSSGTQLTPEKTHNSRPDEVTKSNVPLPGLWVQLGVHRYPTLCYYKGRILPLSCV